MYLSGLMKLFIGDASDGSGGSGGSGGSSDDRARGSSVRFYFALNLLRLKKMSRQHRPFKIHQTFGSDHSSQMRFEPYLYPTNNELERRTDWFGHLGCEDAFVCFKQKPES